MNSKESIIDTSKMSAGERAALELTESSRDSREISGFGASIFNGTPDFNLIFPFPTQPQEDRDDGDTFLSTLESFLKEHTDPDTIDREGEIPDSVIDGLAKIGAFGIKIPKQYGGLGLSQTNYSRAAMQLGGHCGNLTALLSAHQSIGLPQPLLVFGTDQQKEKYLTRCAAGAISAFALTEKDVGSDPARLSTKAIPSDDGKHYILNGEKIWCTNGLKAEAIIVMAHTPTPKKPQSTTAFIVDTNLEGVEIITRCHFMGLRALYNCVIRFNNVRIPKENMVSAEGKGLKVALTTLNTGRLTLPAACVGLLNRCLDISLDWSRSRVQWGQAIGKHAAIAHKIADIAADAFATESLVYFTSALVDYDHTADIRLEAAIAKLWGTEAGWRGVDSTMQIKGGRGYETADSLQNRGERPDPIERFMRDCRINTIFEGSSEIMRLFIAREVLDPHLRRGAGALDSRKTIASRLKTALTAGVFYSKWYPTRYLPISHGIPKGMDPIIARELKKFSSLSRKLSRKIFHSMIRHGAKLDKQQLLLGRIVDIGAELLTASVSASRAQSLGDETSLQLARYICHRGSHRVKSLFSDASNFPDSESFQLAQDQLKNNIDEPSECPLN